MLERKKWLTLAGIVRFEFLMQAQRRWIWFVFFLMILLTVLLWKGSYLNDPTTGKPLPNLTLSAGYLVTKWALQVQQLFPVGVGIMLADRLPRDRKYGVDQLFQSLPASTGVRLLGKYLGATLAILLPVVVVYLSGIFYLAFMSAINIDIVGVIGNFAAINLPGLLFVAAFSITCPALLWVPLYQFLFIGYWMWGNLTNPDDVVPTISGTIITPIGEYPSAAFFGVTFWVKEAQIWQAWASIALLLVMSGLVLAATRQYLVWHQARQ